ncbi:osmoprotectant transport system ATP-binding protein [Salinibacillus kushneri]|uniref:Quaternary amine transport ATP-binding protein n=1 Tax=Salinibacillus kushneri TaxID=237682 RepID=A0A1I0EPB7_9BACI|nr:ABC transporter ATP-binding protein [Salinibacillus kushneri]SET47048.1 osmoprotectant transport system ATP-binding protein [Salinibacillus kushneri]
MITFQNVSKTYPDGTRAVKNVNIDVEDGEFFVIIGPSGSGKTTTLKMINRLIPLTEGTIRIQDKKISDYDIHELRWNIGYVLQQIALFPHMTISENIAIVPDLKKWDQEKIQHRIDELLQMAGLAPDTYRNRKPSELSGGEQQRVGVIRALAADPDLILMDEPFSAVDPITREKLQDDILDLQQNIKKTVVFVTHDMQEALKLGDRICVMRDGKVEQIGTPYDLLKRPANEFVQDFVGTKHPLQNQKVDLEKLIHLNQPEQIEGKTRPLPASTTLQQVIEHLSEQDNLPVEKDGNIIGTINREQVLGYLANQGKERGQKHGAMD